MLSVQPGKQQDHGPCNCCGGTTRTVWGYVSKDGNPYAVYYARWTRARPQHGSVWMISIGDWVSEHDADRYRVGLQAQAPRGSLEFMLVDANETPWHEAAGLGRVLTRDEVLNTELARSVFEVVDATLAADPRLQELRELLESGESRSTAKWRPKRRRK